MADPAPFLEAVDDLVKQVQNVAPQVSDLISVEDGNTIQWVDFVLAGKHVPCDCQCSLPLAVPSYSQAILQNARSCAAFFLSACPFLTAWHMLAGGGMLGIAHVGFTYVLEKAGIRFR